MFPSPPKDIGLLYTPDENNNMALTFIPISNETCSEYSQFSPDIPFAIGFPKEGICNTQKILIVGVVPENGNEPFHLMIDKADNVIHRWGMVDGEMVGKQGEPGDGTTIDYSESFTMTVTCDDDGWVLNVNTELGYPHFFHIFSPLNVTRFEISGDVVITFVGIGDEGYIN